MNLKTITKKLNLTQLTYCNIYLFGSCVYSETFNDIDIAIVYEKGKVHLQDILNYRKTIKEIIYKEFGLSSDVLLLSTVEEVELDFLRNAKTLRVD